MKLTQTILAIAALGITTAEAEQTFAVRKDSCFAEYHGAIYLDGPCFVITGRIDGSFSVVSVDTPDADDMNNHTGPRNS